MMTMIMMMVKITIYVGRRCDDDDIQMIAMDDVMISRVLTSLLWYACYDMT